MEHSKPSESPYLTAAQASKYLGISRETLYNLVWKQTITPLRLGSGKKARLRFTKEQLDKLLGASDVY